MKVKYDPYLDGNVPKKDLFEAGQQSRQAEIDELKWMLRNANGQADDFCKKSIELQKRIDEAWILCEKGCVLKAMSVLKGTNQD